MSDPENRHLVIQLVVKLAIYTLFFFFFRDWLTQSHVYNIIFWHIKSSWCSYISRECLIHKRFCGEQRVDFATSGTPFNWRQLHWSEVQGEKNLFEPPRLSYNDIYYVLSVIFTVTKQQSPRFWPKYNVWQPHVYVHQQRVVRDYARRLILILTESRIVLLWDFELALFSNSCTFSKNRSYAVMQED